MQQKQISNLDIQKAIYQNTQKISKKIKQIKTLWRIDKLILLKQILPQQKQLLKRLATVRKKPYKNANQLLQALKNYNVDKVLVYQKEILEILKQVQANK